MAIPGAAARRRKPPDEGDAGIRAYRCSEDITYAHRGFDARADGD